MLKNIDFKNSVILLPVSSNDELVMLDWVIPYLINDTVIKNVGEFSTIEATHLIFNLDIVNICFIKALYIENDFVHIDLYNVESTLEFFANPDPFPHGNTPVAISNMFPVQTILIDQRIKDLLTEYNEDIFDEMLENNPIVIYDPAELTKALYEIFGGY